MLGLDTDPKFDEFNRREIRRAATELKARASVADLCESALVAHQHAEWLLGASIEAIFAIPTPFEGFDWSPQPLTLHLRGVNEAYELSAECCAAIHSLGFGLVELHHADGTSRVVPTGPLVAAG